jgi:endonuclease/exonuclease/phosphatase (EEP) superfamily protein YafD
VRFARPLLLALSAVLVLLTLLPLWETDRWWVRLWDFPRLQVALLLMICILLVAWVGPRKGRVFWTATGAMLAALAWQATHFIAYLPPWPKQVANIANCPPGRSIELLNANVLLDNHRFGELIALVERTDPDVVLLLEPGLDWERAIRPLHSRYSFRIGEPVPNSYGMILLSRLPMEAQLLHRMQPGVPSIRARLRWSGGEAIDLHGVHPEPPVVGDDSGERDAELVAVGREVRASGRATLVLGDLNDVAWSRTSRLFLDVSGMNDPRVGRGLYPTFNARYPLLRWPLDHMFVTPHFGLQQLDRLDAIGSDHFPILYRVCLTQPAGRRLVPVKASREVREDAREEVKEGRDEKAAENLGQ